MQNIAISDKRRGAVLEVTTKQIIIRPASDGICCCTNHFRTKELAGDTECPRYKILDTSRQLTRLGRTDLTEKLDAVANDSTLQTMIFEPAKLHLHLAFAGTPASQYPLRKLDLTKLFTDGQFPKSRAVAEPQPPDGLPRMAKIDKEKYEATFRYHPVGRPHAVYLAGTFNDWKPTALKMTGPDKDGYYQASIQLHAGRYEYKFVVNGKIWRRDPNNDVQACPHRNSVIEVGQ